MYCSKASGHGKTILPTCREFYADLCKRLGCLAHLVFMIFDSSDDSNHLHHPQIIFRALGKHQSISCLCFRLVDRLFVYILVFGRILTAIRGFLLVLQIWTILNQSFEYLKPGDRPIKLILAHKVKYTTKTI